WEGLALIEASPKAGRLEPSNARRSLADVLDSQDRDEEAVEQFAAVLDAQRRILGPENYHIALDLLELGGPQELPKRAGRSTRRSPFCAPPIPTTPSSTSSSSPADASRSPRVTTNGRAAS
ncbi:MAG TPA: hypothetical protein VJ885_08785, partial [Thermoanaerobaculia bacterium]|nr:hypothetical protein [Thermoanaerobaculia bacterium]